MADGSMKFEMIEFERQLLWRFGFYGGSRKPRRIFNYVIGITSISFIIVFVLGMIIKIIQERNNFEVAFEAFYIMVTALAFLIKLGYYLYHSENFYALEQYMETSIFHIQTPIQGKCYISKAETMYKVFARLYLSACICCATTYTLLPILSNDALLVPIWCPCDVKKFRAPLCIYESLCYAIVGTNNPIIDCLPIAMLISGTAQLDVLNDNLEHLDENDSIYDSSTQEQIIKNRLRICFLHHNAIIKLVAKTQGIFSWGVFFQVFVSVVAICMTGLQFLIAPVKSAKFLCVFIYFVAMIIQVAMFCYFGQGIITKSSEITKACYTSKWYNCNNSVKKSILIIMERAEKPLAFRAGNFFELSLLTFVMILRNAYSYFAVLTQFFDS